MYKNFTKTCLFCKNTFYKKGSYSNFERQKFCSYKCHKDSTRVDLSKVISLKYCLVCNSFIQIKPYMNRFTYSKVKACSIKCRNVLISRVLTGKHKSEEFKKRFRENNHLLKKETIEKRRHKQIGKKLPELVRLKISLANKGKKKSLEWRKKIGDSQRGNKSKNWNGGITSIKEQIRDMPKYKEWRTLVFQRDNYLCKDCYGKNRPCVYLEAHHIKPFSVIINMYNIKSIIEAENCKELWDVNNGLTLCRICHFKTESFGKRSLINFDKNICTI